MKKIKGSISINKTLEVQKNGFLKVMNDGKYIPKHGDKFWFINVFGEVDDMFYKSNYEGMVWLVSHQLVFETKAECEEYKQYLEFLDEYTCVFSYHDWMDSKTFKYTIFYNFYLDSLNVVTVDGIKAKSCSFISRKQVNNFISKVGEKNIKKFMFDIWD